MAATGASWLRQEGVDLRWSRPQKFLAILKEAFGDQRGLSALLTAFLCRRQGIYERVLEYAQSLVMLSTEVNEAKAGTVTDEMLRDRFVDGLYPSSLRRDIRRFVRERDGATFQQARAEALRWTREDSEVEVRTEQVQPGGPVTDLPRAQGAACADSSVDNEDGGAADCIATTRPSTAPATSAVSLSLVQEAGPLALRLES